MKPYYQDSLVTLYHGDCREILPTIRATVCITDPPYNVGIKYGVGTNDERADYREWCVEWFGVLSTDAMQRIAISCGVANIGMWWTITPPTWVMAWHKPAAMGRCVVGFNNWEPILLYGKPPAQIVDVIRAPVITNPSGDGHPCPKPMEWAAKQIGALSVEADTIVDCFAGSGTVLRAAKDLGRKAIGIEINEKYCEIAAERCRQETLGLVG